LSPESKPTGRGPGSPAPKLPKVAAKSTLGPPTANPSLPNRGRPRQGLRRKLLCTFITETKVITRILDHIRKRDRVSRSPPPPQSAVAHIA
jgi:hypothetical protein